MSADIGSPSVQRVSVTTRATLAVARSSPGQEQRQDHRSGPVHHRMRMGRPPGLLRTMTGFALIGVPVNSIIRDFVEVFLPYMNLAAGQVD